MAKKKQAAEAAPTVRVCHWCLNTGIDNGRNEHHFHCGCDKTTAKQARPYFGWTASKPDGRILQHGKWNHGLTVVGA